MRIKAMFIYTKIQQRGRDLLWHSNVWKKKIFQFCNYSKSMIGHAWIFIDILFIKYYCFPLKEKGKRDKDNQLLINNVCGVWWSKCSELITVIKEICKAMYFQCETVLATTKQSALGLSLGHRLLSIQISLHCLVFWEWLLQDELNIRFLSFF